MIKWKRLSDGRAEREQKEERDWMMKKRIETGSFEIVWQQ